MQFRVLIYHEYIQLHNAINNRRCIKCHDLLVFSAKEFEERLRQSLHLILLFQGFLFITIY